MNGLGELFRCIPKMPQLLSGSPCRSSVPDRLDVKSEDLTLPDALNVSDRHLRLLRCFRTFGSDENGAFEQPAEILFAGVLVLAVGELEIGGGFITHFESFEVNDAHKFIAALPDLALLEFHGMIGSTLAFVQGIVHAATASSTFIIFIPVWIQTITKSSGDGNRLVLSRRPY